MDYHPDFAAKLLRQQATIEKLRRAKADLDAHIMPEPDPIMAGLHEADLELAADPDA